MTYDCTMQRVSHTGQILRNAFDDGWALSLSYDEATFSGTVSDPAIQAVYGQAITAEFERRGRQSVVMAWRVVDAPLNNRQISNSVDFVATLQEDTGRISIRLQLTGAYESAIATGQCTRSG